MTVDHYFTPYEGTPPRHSKECSVHTGRKRFEKAKEQASLPPAPLKKIIALVNEFFAAAGMVPCDNPILRLELGQKVDYKKIQKENGLQDERDIVWMKFTLDGYLGVVAVSNDIGFDVPPSSEEYNQKIQYKSCFKWRFSTSGILIHFLGKQWDDSFALVFPLKNMPAGYNRHHIEMGIGNYLIAKGVPILDFYSHNYWKAVCQGEITPIISFLSV